jgi:hypothetical protein
MLITDEHLLAGGGAVIDCHVEPVCSSLEHKVVTLLQFMESSTGRPPFLEDNFVLVDIGMDNPSTIFAALNLHWLVPLHVTP